MNGNERAEVFAALAELARRYPHWRIGQSVANVAGWVDAEIWDAEDAELLAAAREHLEMSAPTSSIADHAVPFASVATVARASD